MVSSERSGADISWILVQATARAPCWCRAFISRRKPWSNSVEKVEHLDFSAIEAEVDGAIELEPLPEGRLNVIDLQTAIELYTPVYALLLGDRDFWRASNSLQLDETIGLYAARLTGEEKHLAMINNRHPLVPFATLGAGFRLMLHGLSTELLHGFLREMKARHQHGARASA